MRWLVCMFVVATVGCFNPTLPAISCGVGNSCPKDFECNVATNSCEPPGDIQDAAVTIDARTVDAALIDAVPEADVLLVDCTGWTSAYFDPCSLPITSDVLTFTPGAYVIDTSNETITPSIGSFSSVVVSQPGENAWLITADAIMVAPGATIRVIGNRSLILAAPTQIAIEGTIDVSIGGAGSQPSACLATAPVEGMVDNSGSGGSGGGAFQGSGGAGSGGEDPTTGGAGGTSVPLPTVIRGGCRGAAGGDSSGVGGLGGGGLLLSARDLVTVLPTGTLSAGGGGGDGGDGKDAGGSGGGSGGMLVLEAMMVSSEGILVANGGAGGAGSDNANSGLPGEDGQLSSTRSLGGVGVGAGGTGGSGGANVVPNGTDGIMVDDGGGGGGAGAGYIVIRANSFDLMGVVSPFPEVNP